MKCTTKIFLMTLLNKIYVQQQQCARVQKNRLYIVQRGAEEICDGVGGQMCKVALFC